MVSIKIYKNKIDNEDEQVSVYRKGSLVSNWGTLLMVFCVSLIKLVFSFVNFFGLMVTLESSMYKTCL